MTTETPEAFVVQESDPVVQQYLAYLNREASEKPSATNEQIRLARMLWGRSKVDEDRPAAQQRLAETCARFNSLIITELNINALMKYCDTQNPSVLWKELSDHLKESRFYLNSAIRTINFWHFCKLQIPKDIIQRARECFDTLGWLQLEFLDARNGCKPVP